MNTRDSWKKNAEKNARHQARIYIEYGDAKRAYDCLSIHEPLACLEYLYALACTYHGKGLHTCARTALEATVLVKRPVSQEAVIKEKSAIQRRRHTPKEIFLLEI